MEECDMMEKSVSGGGLTRQNVTNWGMEQNEEVHNIPVTRKSMSTYI